MSNKEFNKAVIGCVTAMAEVFGRAVSDATFSAYAMGLEGLTPQQVTQATKLALAQCKWMPPPMELREMLTAKLSDRAAKAWLCFERAVTRHGHIRSVTFDDVVINATVRALGGWEKCCTMSSAEFDSFLQKRFQDTYCALCRIGAPKEMTEPLIGSFDRENAANKFPVSAPITINTGLPCLMAPVTGIPDSPKLLDKAS